MLASLRQNLTYANVVSTLCLFILLGGSSYAAVTLKKNSVKGKHIAKNAVTAPKVADGSLLARDFAAGELPKGEKGDPGERGPEGKEGAEGPPGFDAATFWAAVSKDGVLLDGVGVTQVYGHSPGTGRYSVDFADTIADCAVIAGITYQTPGSGSLADFAGLIHATIGGPVGSSADRTVHVQAAKKAEVGEVVDRPFHLAVLC